MSERERCCAACGALAMTRDRYCIQCGGNHFVWVSAPPELAALIIVCTRCGEQIDAGDAWHSREAGKALCRACKHLEARHEP